MAIPPWTVEILRRGLNDVARKARQPDTLEKIKSQASEMLHDLPETAARGIEAMMRTAEAGKQSVERWARRHTAIAIPTINATGVLLGDDCPDVPLSNDAVELGRELFAGGVVVGPMLEQKLERLLPHGKDYAMAVASSFPAALTALSLLVQERSLVIHRKHAVRLPNGLPLPEAFGMLVPVIQEVGSVDRIDPSDFAGLDSFCAIIGDGGHRDVELLDFVGRDAIQAVVLPVGTLNDSPHRQVPSAESLLTAGADLVVFPGDQLCGGPSCGVIVGRRREIKTMTQSRSWSSLSASQAVMAMLWATLESAGGDRRIPIQVLLDASEENLRDRAERMATRLQGSDSIKSCQVSGHDALVTANGRWRFLSRQVRARHASKSSKTWQQNLLERVPAIATTVHDDELCVDLRWVAAADDPKVSAALVGSDTHVSASAEDRD